MSSVSGLEGREIYHHPLFRCLEDENGVLGFSWREFLYTPPLSSLLSLSYGLGMHFAALSLRFSSLFFIISWIPPLYWSVGRLVTSLSIYFPSSLAFYWRFRGVCHKAELAGWLDN